jgi:WD40 repeat protein
MDVNYSFLKFIDYNKRINGHTGYIRSLVKLDDEKIISGSDDATIRIWNFEGECIKCIKSVNPIRLLGLFSDGRIVSSDSLQCLKIWDQKGNCKNSIDVTGMLSFIVLSNNTIATGSNDSTIKIYDEEGNNIKTYGTPEENYRENKVIELPDGKIASCLYYSYFNHFYCLRIWHKNKSTDEKNIQIHSYAKLKNGGIALGSRFFLSSNNYNNSIEIRK